MDTREEDIIMYISKYFDSYIHAFFDVYITHMYLMMSVWRLRPQLVRSAGEFFE